MSKLPHKRKLFINIRVFSLTCCMHFHFASAVQISQITNTVHIALNDTTRASLWTFIQSHTDSWNENDSLLRSSDMLIKTKIHCCLLQSCTVLVQQVKLSVEDADKRNKILWRWTSLYSPEAAHNQVILLSFNVNVNRKGGWPWTNRYESEKASLLKDGSGVFQGWSWRCPWVVPAWHRKVPGIVPEWPRGWHRVVQE